ncbi:uncharacterized protein I303_107675 [Kwoniella dejecticola CBS 10117]|uniref:FAS1 domain-containing protein n=1 Tax=Kwoniella dejecticola CBS 10117 TaxID=1296121 RepID=A0A1A5ZVD9_9TREE|nr:uncharacterized protein I303_07684 [Kwoniella dejecticola CBS 10117]OBR81774.1 hypothetical protein I303_07684 [Kwoniella dejecticola CBS 10117]
MKFTTLSSLLLLPATAYAQSSSASAAASGSASAAAPSASAAGNSSDYLTTVLGALTGAGLTSLVGAAQGIANTTEGQALLGSLANGNKTVFAPSNQALSNISQDILGNSALLTQILSYHILNNTYTAAGVANAPNHTIARSLLRGGNYTLPGNFSAPLVLTKNSTNATSFEIVQTAANISAGGNATAANLHVYVIDQVLSLPQSLTEALPAVAPQLFGLAGSIPGLADSLASANGITIFAPSDSAIGAIQSSLGQLNSTQVTAVLSNHIINGTVVYSTGLASGNYTSAGGEPFTFISNSTGAFVQSANSTAKIVQSDIILNNGVVHLIDNVLVNTASNPQAAESAYSSATAAAATSTEADTPVTATSQATGPSASASGSGGSSAGFKVAPIAFTNSMMGGIVAVVGAIVGGAFTLF